MHTGKMPVLRHIRATEASVLRLAERSQTSRSEVCAIRGQRLARGSA